MEIISKLNIIIKLKDGSTMDFKQVKHVEVDYFHTYIYHSNDVYIFDNKEITEFKTIIGGKYINEQNI